MSARAQPLPEPEVGSAANWNAAALILASQCSQHTNGLRPNRLAAVDACRARLCEAEMVGYHKGLAVGQAALKRIEARSAPPPMDMPSIALTVISTLLIVLGAGLWMVS